MQVGVAPLQAQLPKIEEEQRNNLAHTPLCSLLNLLNTAHSHCQIKQHRRARRETSGRKVDSHKNLNQLLSQHPQKADEGHIQEAFHWRKRVLKYL